MDVPILKQNKPSHISRISFTYINQLGQFFSKMTRQDNKYTHTHNIQGKMNQTILIGKLLKLCLKAFFFLG